MWIMNYDVIRKPHSIPNLQMANYNEPLSVQSVSNDVLLCIDWDLTRDRSKLERHDTVTGTMNHWLCKLLIWLLITLIPEVWSSWLASESYAFLSHTFCLYFEMRITDLRITKSFVIVTRVEIRVRVSFRIFWQPCPYLRVQFTKS
jgi:hypothetical protein